MIITPLSNIKVFISYRRNDTASSTGRLFPYLKQAFGKKNIFKDIFSMEGGDKVRERIYETIKQSDVLLLIIGKDWFNIQKTKDPQLEMDDYVLFEISTALQLGITIIPVLVDSATMLDEPLPNTIKEIRNINACELTSKHYEYDVEKLIQNIKSQVHKKRSKYLRIFYTIIFSFACIVLAMSLNYFFKNKPKQLKIGEHYGGGIIFDLDESREHGLISAFKDLDTMATWYNSFQACKRYNAGGFHDWYLPDKQEIIKLYNKKDIVKNFSSDCVPGNFGNCSYWSSSEMNSADAWNLYFTNGLFWSNFNKNGPSRVRPIRKF
jgi:hypothetical protein